MEKKRLKAREWHMQDAVMKGLKKPKDAKKILILAEEPEDAQPNAESHSSIVEPYNDEMVGTASMPSPMMMMR